MRFAAVVLLGTASFACGEDEDKSLMTPGEDCLDCHDGVDASRLTAAGTVFGSADAPVSAGLAGVTVEIVDATGKTIELTTNTAGNFYTAEDLQMPLQTAVSKDGVRLAADSDISSGACNSCHDLPPTDQAEGRLYWKAD